MMIGQFDWETIDLIRVLKHLADLLCNTAVLYKLEVSCKENCKNVSIVKL